MRANEEVFTISDNFIRITFPFENNFIETTIKNDAAVEYAVVNAVEEKNNLIVDYVTKNPGCRKPMISNSLKINIRTLERHIKLLVDNDRLAFKGAPKTGGYYAL